MTREEIMRDLKDIRYYHSRERIMRDAEEKFGSNALTEKEKRYGAVIRMAPIRIYDVYIGMYILNNTQESLSEKWGCSVETIKRYNKKLYIYLEENSDLL